MEGNSAQRLKFDFQLFVSMAQLNDGLRRMFCSLKMVPLAPASRTKVQEIVAQLSQRDPKKKKHKRCKVKDFKDCCHLWIESNENSPKRER